jgi:hypothetical protein
MSVALDRRDWLRIALALGLGPLLERVEVADALSDFWRARATDDLRRAGELVRAAGVPVSPDELLGDFSGGGDEALAEFLAHAVRADFEADRVRFVGAWLLAETECRVLAVL